MEDMELCLQVIRDGFPVDKPIMDCGMNLLMHVASTCGEEQLTQILDLDLNINLCDKIGRTALHFACRAGKLENFKILASQDDIEVNSITKAGVTALMMAVESRNPQLVAECLSLNLNPFLKDALNRTALDYAKKYRDMLGQDMRDLIQEKMNQLLQTQQEGDRFDNQQTFSGYYQEFIIDTDPGQELEPQAVVQEFLKFITSLSLAENEISRLTASLQEPQIEKMSNYLPNPHDKTAQVSHLIQKLIVQQFEEPLVNLKKTIQKEYDQWQKSMEEQESQMQLSWLQRRAPENQGMVRNQNSGVEKVIRINEKELEEQNKLKALEKEENQKFQKKYKEEKEKKQRWLEPMKTAIDQKIEQKFINIDKNNPIDIQIANAFTIEYLLNILTSSQWCSIFVDEILFEDNLKLLMELLTVSEIENLIQEIWSKHDTDGNGYLDKDGTKALIRDNFSDMIDNVTLKEEDKPQLFDQSFHDFDKEGSGTIDKGEMVQFIKQVCAGISQREQIPRASKFWVNLDNQQKILIWRIQSEKIQKSMLTLPTILIDKNQKAQLWAQIIMVKEACQIWNLLSKDQKSQTLDSMSAEVQFGLWSQVYPDEQTNFLHFLHNKFQKAQLLDQIILVKGARQIWNLFSNDEKTEYLDVMKTQVQFILWSQVQPEDQTNFIHLLKNKNQKAQLFEQIILVKRACQIWSLFSCDDKTVYLDALKTKVRIELWTQLYPQDQANFLNFISNQGQKVQFWSKMSHQIQLKALKQLKRDSVVELINILNTENLCLAISMHRDYVFEDDKKNMISLLKDEEKKIAVETFIKFGKSSKYDCTSQQLIQKLVEKQYDDFGGIENLRSIKDSYVQVIEHPQIRNGMMTLADDKRGVKVYSDKQTADESHSNNPICSDNNSQQAPTLLHPTPTVDGEWKMDQINPDPGNKSVICIYQHMDDESAYWCTGSFTIYNRISQLIKGQDDQVYIFARENLTPKSEQKQNIQVAKNNILLHIFDSYRHEIIIIPEFSHLAEELLRKNQVSRSGYGRYMWQAPNLIGSNGNWLLAYTSATRESGPGIYFYNLKTSRTFACIGGAELLVDCYYKNNINQGEIQQSKSDIEQCFLDAGVNHIRYITSQKIVERSVNFDDQTDQQSSGKVIYDITQQQQTLIQQTLLVHFGSDTWGYRHQGCGYFKEVFVHVNKYEDKENFKKSFQLLFKTREHNKIHEINWCACFQSYEEVTQETKFKLTKQIPYAECIVTKQRSNSKTDLQTLVVSHSRDKKDVWLIESQISQQDLKALKKNDFDKDLHKLKSTMTFDKCPKLCLAVTFKSEKLFGLFISQNDLLKNFMQNKQKVDLQYMLQDKLYEKVVLSYPLMFYTGLTPDCRQIVIANLADTKQPQKIVTLPDGWILQNMVRSQADDRLYFQAFQLHEKGGFQNKAYLRYSYELVCEFPFIRNRDHHSNDIYIRRIQTHEHKNLFDVWHKEVTQSVSIDWVCDDNSNLDSSLFEVALIDKNTLKTGAYDAKGRPQGTEVIKGLSNGVLRIQRSSQNNFYWLDVSPSSTNILQGLINISSKSTGKKLRGSPISTLQSNRLSPVSLSDSSFISIVVGSKNVESNLVDQITLLDKDLNLYQYRVNQQFKKFEQFGDVRNLSSQLQLDTEWLQFNGKEQIDFEKYKPNYRLYSAETIGVVIGDYIVYQNIESKALAMVDTSHQLFLRKINKKTEGRSKTVIKMNQNIDNSDYRLLECQDTNTKQSYFVVYPALESRKLDLFGGTGRSNVLSANFISDSLIVAQFKYKDIKRSWFGKAIVKKEEKYWSVIDKAGKIKAMPFTIEKHCSIIFQQQLDTGILVITFDAITTRYQVCKFNLRGELYFQSMFDDKDILQNTFLMIEKNVSTVKSSVSSYFSRKFSKSISDGNITGASDKLSFSEVFCGSKKGELYRFVAYKDFSATEKGQNFSLQGSVKFPIKNQNQQNMSQVALTLLVLVCKSEEQYQSFRQASFQICQDNLCIFAPKEKSIRIISLRGSEIVVNQEIFPKERKQSIETYNQADGSPLIKNDSIQIQRADQLRIIKSIEQRQFNVIDHSSDDVISGFQAQLDKDNTPSNLEEFTWLNFDQNDERKIDLKNLIIDNQSDDNSKSLKLDCLEFTTKQLSLKVAKNKKYDSQEDDENYLQISIGDRVYLYDLSFDCPKECFSCFEIDFFTDPRSFVDLGLAKIWLKTEKTIWREVTTNHQRNLSMAKDIIQIEKSEEQIPNQTINHRNVHYESSNQKFLFLLKNYSVSDLQGLHWLNQKLTSNFSSKQVANSFESMMVSYQGHNFFSLFNDDQKLKLILEFIHEQLDQRHQELGEVSEIKNSSFVRRIYQILTMPIPEFTAPQKNLGQENMSQFKRDVGRQDGVKEQNSDQKDQASHFKTALERCIEKDFHLRDLFITIAQNSDEFQIQDFACDQQKMKQILQSYSSALNKFLINQVIETPITKEITELSWPVKKLKTTFTFKLSSQAIGKQQVFDNHTLSQVIVKLLKTKWLLQDYGTFSKFSQILEDCSSDRIYETEFMKNLVEGYWEQNSRIIKLVCFVPWLVYLALTNVLFVKILRPETMDQEEGENEPSGNFTKIALSLVTMIFLSFQMWIEYIQLDKFSYKGLKDHFSSIWNVQDLIQYSSTAWITLSNLKNTGSSYKEIQRIVAAFSLIIIWAKFFDWLRIFENTAFYVRLLSKTLQDITSFIILYLVALAMFGSAMFMLQLNHTYHNDDELFQIEKGKIVESSNDALIEGITDFFFLDIMLNQYLLSLGEFQQDGFNNHAQWYLCWLFFLMATFFTQITMLNMLIAIMGNTFEMVIEKKAIHAMETKLQIMSEYQNVISLIDLDTENFLFVVKPVIDDEEMEDERSWEGGFNFLRKSLFNKIDQLNQNQSWNKNQQMNQILKVSDQIKSGIAKIREDNKQTNLQTKDDINAKTAKLENQAKETADEIKELKAQIEKLTAKTSDEINEIKTQNAQILNILLQREQLDNEDV